ncbi:hypothetical protein LCL95_01465 [Bacillus timonensis]|nr:hypothetical protein [Bacillus timonensis]
MVIMIYVLLSWILTGVFITLSHKPSDKMAYTFLFMVLSIITTNWNYIVFEKLKMSTYPNELDKYYALILDRSVNIPILILFTVHSFTKMETLKGKYSAVLIGLAVFIGYDFLGVTLNVNLYKGWNSIYSMLIVAGSVFLAIFLKRWFERKVNVAKGGML